MKRKNNLVAILMVIFVIAIAGCCSTPEKEQTSSKKESSEPAVSQTAAAAVEEKTKPCEEKECFIKLANDCNSIAITLKEDAGTFKYTASKDCVFTKTIISAENETDEMKKLLEGKSLECRYEKGMFDNRWINSLIYGSEYCSGELKDTLAQLLIFVE